MCAQNLQKYVHMRMDGMNWFPFLFFLLLACDYTAATVDVVDFNAPVIIQRKWNHFIYPLEVD